VSKRQESWSRLEALLKRASGSRLGGLRPDEVLSLAALYRRSTADLARAQRDWPEEPVTRYLNGLVARGHAALYREGGDVFRRLRHFYAATLPQTFRASGAFIIAAAALLFVPAVAAYFTVLKNPGLATAFVPPDIINRVHHHQLWTQIAEADRPLMAGLIMTNNIYVAITAFTLGVLAGLPTIYVLISNGVSIGGVLGLTEAYGVGGGLLAFMVGHGVLELSIIVAEGAKALGGGPLVGAIGPGIGPCCYEVGEEVREPFRAAYGDEVVIDNRLDLWSAAEQALRAAGCEEVERTDLCTYCHPELFFSHRRDRGRTGRQGVVAYIA